MKCEVRNTSLKQKVMHMVRELRVGGVVRVTRPKPPNGTCRFHVRITAAVGGKKSGRWVVKSVNAEADGTVVPLRQRICQRQREPARLSLKSVFWATCADKTFRTTSQ